jgi:hypothetical protein
MAKTLNQFLEGYLKVKNPDEQKFVDKHVVAKHSDRNGNDDEVFKGSKVKQIDRRKERHGYNPGEDEKVYEELKGNQHKIDANKNGKVDAHDFKLLRKKKKVAEEAEQIDELSKKTLATYAIKAKNQMGRDEARAGYQRGIRTMDGKGQGEMERAHDKRAEKRSKGIDTALNKLAKEEVEIEEKLNMDKATMGDVIKDFQDSNAPQFKGKSKEKRRVMAIAAKLTAERGGKPLRKEEKLADLLGDLTESHRRTMLSVFDKLNEDNQKKFLEACGTPAGVEQMLDFSISHRGE